MAKLVGKGQRTHLANSIMHVAKPTTTRVDTITRTNNDVANRSPGSPLVSTNPYTTSGISNGDHNAATVSSLPFLVVGAPSHEVTQPRMRRASLFAVVMPLTDRPD